MTHGLALRAGQNRPSFMGCCWLRFTRRISATPGQSGLQTTSSRLPSSSCLLRRTWYELRRKEIAVVVKIEPEPVGLGILLFGVWVAVAAYLLNIKYIGFASLPISLAGLVLFLHGRGLLRLTRYPIALLLFACPWPAHSLAR